MKTIATDKKLCVVGLGHSGLSCARFLSKLGKPIALADTRSAPPNMALIEREFSEAPKFFGPLDAEILSSMDELFVAPGLSIQTPEIQKAQKAGVKIRGDIDLFTEHANAPVIAITGSNGKSTVTTLLGEMAKAQGLNVAVGGNLGTPALDLIADNVDLYVLELSSFQLETTANLSADVVTLLNISEDHMDRYPDRMAYLNAKRRIFFGAKTVVVNDDELLSAPMVSEQMSLVHFGLNGQDLKKFSTMESAEGDVITRGFEDMIPVKEIGMRGRHNISNALAALALGSAYGLRTDAMLTALRSFKGLPHRCEWVREFNGIDFINDSKGTNTGATSVAINSFGCASPLIWIAGGEGKGADFSVLAPFVRQHVKHTILFGRDADQIAEVLDSDAPISRVDNLAEAIKVSVSLGHPGDVVLFSPACASFDMFRDYNDRGDQFRSGVLAL